MHTAAAVASAQPEMLLNSRRNAGIELRPEAFESIQVNLSAVERRAATLPTRRTVKKEYQAAWLVKAVTCIDLTTLAGDDTAGRVRRLCAKARRPIRQDILEALGLAGERRPDALSTWLAQLETVPEELLFRAVERVPISRLSPLGKRFTCEILRYNRRRILSLPR